MSHFLSLQLTLPRSNGFKSRWISQLPSKITASELLEASRPWMSHWAEGSSRFSQINALIDRHLQSFSHI